MRHLYLFILFYYFFFEGGTQWSNRPRYAVRSTIRCTETPYSIPWRRTLYFGPVGQWTETSGGITQHARIHATRRAVVTSRKPSLVISVLGFCVISHFTFSVKALFLSAWVRIPPKPHLTKFCPFSVHCSSGQNIPRGAMGYRGPCGPLLHWGHTMSDVSRRTFP